MACFSEPWTESSAKRIMGRTVSSPHLQDASPLVLLAVREQVSGEERVAGQADSVGPVAVIFQLRTVVRALCTHYLWMGAAGLRKLGWSPGAQPHCTALPTHFPCMSLLHGAGSGMARQNKL